MLPGYPARTEKDAAGYPSLPWHDEPINELRHKPYLAGRLPYVTCRSEGAGKQQCFPATRLIPLANSRRRPISWSLGELGPWRIGIPLPGRPGRIRQRYPLLLTPLSLMTDLGRLVHPSPTSCEVGLGS
jgi:hypothetical protein